MGFLTLVAAEASAEKSPRVYAPAEARIRKDATPWDAEVLASCGRVGHAAEAAEGNASKSR